MSTSWSNIYSFGWS